MRQLRRRCDKLRRGKSQQKEELRKECEIHDFVKVQMKGRIED
jgi:hypothetical protein